MANAHHLIYAYSVTDESGMRITGHSDDGKWSASKLLEYVLDENTLVVNTLAGSLAYVIVIMCHLNVTYLHVISILYIVIDIVYV